MSFLGGIGGSSARSRQSSSSSSQSDSISASFDNLDSFGFGISEDFSRSGGESVSGGSDVSSSRSRSGSRVAFEDVFARLFGGASGAAAGIDTSAITGASNLLFSSGRDFLSGLQGSPELEAQFGAADADEAGQIELLKSDIGEFLAETVNPAITQRGVQAGTLGGSRGEVQRGIASEAALEEFVRGVTGIRGATQARKDTLAGALATDRLGRSSTALSQLPALFGLAESGAFASLSPFAALSQILGPQTVLTDAEAESLGVGSSFGRSTQFGESAGSSLSLDTTTGRAGSASRSTSSSESKSSGSSKSKSFSLGF